MKRSDDWLVLCIERRNEKNAGFGRGKSQFGASQPILVFLNERTRAGQRHIRECMTIPSFRPDAWNHLESSVVSVPYLKKYRPNPWNIVTSMEYFPVLCYLNGDEYRRERRMQILFCWPVKSEQLSSRAIIFIEWANNKIELARRKRNMFKILFLNNSILQFPNVETNVNCWDNRSR